MADVSVEFGAQDVGLEKALQQIQTEMGNLQGKVKSGELSMEELEATMKRIGQVENMEKRLKAMGDQSGAASPKVDALGKDIKGAGDKSEKMGDQAGLGFGKLAAAVGVGQLAAKAFTAVLDAGFAAVRGTIQGFTAALDLGGTLSDLSASTGESAGNLLLLQRAFDNTGAGADKVGPVLSKLSAAINNTDEDSKKAALGFGRMGISLAELQGKSATDQLNLVSQGLQSIKDPGERAAAAVAVFGNRIGPELLPLLTNFSGEMDEARATVGSLADIMDRRANVFDAVGDRFLIIQQKVRDFAAGILDKALPAIDAITSALSRIDAAAIGQKLADSFLGGQQAMKGFQAAVDAISVGKVGLAFEVFWESLKLQAMQTADEIYKRLIAAFQSAGQFLAEIFSPSGALISTVLDGFDLLGARIAETIQSKLAAALSGNFLTQGISDNLRVAAEESKLAADKISESMTGAGGRIAEQFVNAGKALPDSFSENYAKIPPLFADLAAQQTKVAELEGQVTAATAATTAERATQAKQTEDELKKRQELKDQQAAADAQAKSDKTAIIELETQLNLAKAAGNAELVASLEKQLEQKKSTEEIAKLTEDYMKNLGVTKEEAGVLATNFVNAKNAAAGVKVDKTTVSEAKAEAGKAAEAAKSFATWLDYIKGVDPSKPVKSLKEQTADARKEITAFGEYIGKDLKNKSFPDIARELGVKTLGTTGKEQMDAILSYISSQRGKLTGIQPVDEKGGKSAIAAIQEKIKSSLGGKQDLALDASKSLETVKSKLKENVDLSLSSSKGTEILGNVKETLGQIHEVMKGLSNKLPVAALTA